MNSQRHVPKYPSSMFCNKKAIHFKTNHYILQEHLDSQNEDQTLLCHSVSNSHCVSSGVITSSKTDMIFFFCFTPSSYIRLQRLERLKEDRVIKEGPWFRL